MVKFWYTVTNLESFNSSGKVDSFKKWLTALLGRFKWICIDCFRLLAEIALYVEDDHLQLPFYTTIVTEVILIKRDKLFKVNLCSAMNIYFLVSFFYHKTFAEPRELCWKELEFLTENLCWRPFGFRNIYVGGCKCVFQENYCTPL